MREGKIISVCKRENRHTHTQSVRERHPIQATRSDKKKHPHLSRDLPPRGENSQLSSLVPEKDARAGVVAMASAVFLQ